MYYKFSTRKIVRKRSFKNFNEANHLEALSHTSWWDINKTEDVDDAVGLMTNKLTQILDKMAPVKSFQVCNHYAPWISTDTKILMKNMNGAS